MMNEMHELVLPYMVSNWEWLGRGNSLCSAHAMSLIVVVIGMVSVFRKAQSSMILAIYSIWFVNLGFSM
jgi:hypothetical protein